MDQFLPGHDKKPLRGIGIHPDPEAAGIASTRVVMENSG
jgi:hypothetical protein